MKKFISFALMALFATSLWAVDPAISFEIPVSGASKSDYFKDWTVETSVITLSSTMDLSSNDSHQNISIGSSAGNLNANYISIKVKSGMAILDSIAVYAGGSGNNKGVNAPVIGWTTGYAEQTTTANSLDYISFTSASSGGGKIDNAHWYLVDLSGDDIKEARIYKKLSKNQVSIEGEDTSNDLGSGETIRIWGIKIWVHFAADETAPTLSSSTPANGATGVATSGTIVLTFDEAIASVDDSKFSLDGATLGTVAIDGTDAKKVNVAYSDAEELSVVTLAVAAGAVSDAAANASAALTDISFTTEGTCTAPAITTNLSTTLVEYVKDASATALAIEATGKSLTYQWYSNTTNSTEGATSLGESARSASYTPSTATLGTKYYYCVVSSGECSTTSAITPVKVNYVRASGWVIFDGMIDNSFTDGSITYNSVTVNYTVVGNSMLDADGLTARNKNNDFNDYTYPNAVKIEKHNPGAETPVNAYVSFTIPSSYMATKIILALGVAGGSRDIVLAKSAVTTVDAEDVIAHFSQSGKSDRIYDATYTPSTALAAGTYYILTPVGGTWNIFHLQLLLDEDSASSLDNTTEDVKAIKHIENGQLIIEKNGVRYNAMGQIIR